VDVKKDQLVTITTQFGKIGITGHSTGPHLHLSFRVNGVSKKATAPSKRPSPMQTTTGSWKLNNGGFGTVSKNGQPPITPELPVNPTQPPVGHTNPPQTNTCASCVFANRPDILPFYQSNGWNIDPSNWDNILANWCSIDPSGCAVEKAMCGVCGTNPTVGPTATPAPNLPCSSCIIANRPDILPFYQSNGWDISESNWDNIIANWCSIDPSGCAAEKAKCSSCGSGATTPPNPTSDPGQGCSACIIANRPDILPFYRDNGWSIDQSNWDNIIAN
jgi:hypothetical protein